jgi:hypothetical protein
MSIFHEGPNIFFKQRPTCLVDLAESFGSSWQHWIILMKYLYRIGGDGAQDLLRTLQGGEQDQQGSADVHQQG